MDVQLRIHRRNVVISRPLFYALVVLLVFFCLLCVLIPLFVYLHQPSCPRTTDDSITEPPIRLPSSLIPEKYFLSIKLFIPSPAVKFNRNSNFSFTGNVTIHFQCVQETSEIALHADRLRIDESSFQLTDRSTQAKQYRLDKMQTFVPVEQTVFRLTKPLKPGAYALQLRYSGILSESLEGFYRSSYVENGEKKLALTNTPLYARFINQDCIQVVGGDAVSAYSRAPRLPLFR